LEEEFFFRAFSRVLRATALAHLPSPIISINIDAGILAHTIPRIFEERPSGWISISRLLLFSFTSQLSASWISQTSRL